ncbi:hypothetical protein BOTBODRAFT_33987 [Botryobasidium botryosum FD-172 SS1]|uniref:Uncharacterized protein n=1 Tax=Botryobasidium botryosum (strain FD-172 SS1) TaxID=930990 RepID=A0A067MMR7_BOTB1|nr:hypothetical protein BOTBODRAFT_33987 [Botryobasidium botryosum FD-172 SS1]
MLANLPTFTSLALRRCPSSFVRVLRVRADSHSHLCPLLKRLRLESNPLLSSERLYEIIRSRANPNRSVSPAPSVPSFELVRRDCSLVVRGLVAALQKLSVEVDWDRAT